MVKVALILQKIWCSLVETPQFVQRQGYHGVYVGYVNQCELRRKISVAKNHMRHIICDILKYMHRLDVLVMAIRARCDIRVEEPNYSTNSFRKAAYRQYII
jgi:hypothetical protein